MRVYLATLGCKLNESELEAWSRRFARDGHEIVADPRQADVCVLNTCTVTHVAARKSRQLARQVARANPQARLVLTGCYASLAEPEAARLPNVALVVPNADKDRLVSLAGALIGDVRFQTTATGCRMPEAASGSLTGEAEPAGGLQSGSNPTPRTRAFVKIMDGCNMSCSYCIIPLARGKERSRPLPEVVAEVDSLVKAGFQEIILTGVQISVYEHNGDKAHGLRDLVAAILATTGVPRLRLTSIAPWDLDESLLELWRDPCLCRHLHLSLQSGSDTVLRRMKRGYTTAQFAHAVETARERIADVGVTTDVIVGFPGESDAEFEASLRFVEELKFSRVHVFPYSSREGTVAAQLPLQVSEPVKQARAREMQRVADQSAQVFAKGFIGRTMSVLWESVATRQLAGEEDGAAASDRALWSGYTDNYIRVTAPQEGDLHNRITSVDLVELAGDEVKGRLNGIYPVSLV